MKFNIQRLATVRISLFLVCVAIICYFLPTEDQNRYTYEINRPWGYSLLTAPFDIPVRLDSVSAAAIKDSIDKRFEPVFYRVDSLSHSILETYARRLVTTPGLSLTAAQRGALLSEIKKLYDGGIVDQNAFSEIKAGRMPQVRMLSNKVAVSVSTSHFRSARSAYAHLDSVFRNPDVHAAIASTRLSELLLPNVVADTLETERFRNELYQSALAPTGVIQQGERIIDRGDIVTPQLYTVLNTYEELCQERGDKVVADKFYPIAGRVAFLLLLIGSLYTYLYFYRRDYFDNIRIFGFLLMVVTIFTLLAIGLSATFTSGLYIAPFTIITILVLVFLDSRTSFFTFLVTVLLCTFVSRFPLEFVIVQFVAGLTALVSIKELSRRSQLIRTALLVFVAYVVTYCAMELMASGSPERVSWSMVGSFGINAVFTSFAYILVFIFEKMFGFTSRVTLVELSDINNPLLRELSEECPGTFQHSMAVSTLASAAAHRIGANVQLVRAGALYHDIGKISNPAFFTENQHGVNPHDALDPIQSARIVIGHVADGIKRADKAKLPARIRDFILEHHGKGKARYFYTTYCNAHPGEDVDDSLFTYPGPNPGSRETSLLMMADAVEAASRSMNNHSPEAITALVNKIIDTQINEGLHNDSTLSFRDVKEIKDSFISRLRTMYHSRISYPEAIKQ